MPVTEASPARPEFFRLPKPGTTDPHFGFSRVFYYNGEARGWWKLIRIRDRGKNRGVTVVEYSAIANFVRSQMKGAK
jgi:hypothetical protein